MRSLIIFSEPSRTHIARRVAGSKRMAFAAGVVAPVKAYAALTQALFQPWEIMKPWAHEPAREWGLLGVYRAGIISTRPPRKPLLDSSQLFPRGKNARPAALIMRTSSRAQFVGKKFYPLRTSTAEYKLPLAREDAVGENVGFFLFSYWFVYLFVCLFLFLKILHLITYEERTDSL